MENFAVKSDSFALYEAFKKDVEKIGWEYNEKFTPFCTEAVAHTDCLFFDNKWWGVSTPLSFSLTHHSGKYREFSLETQYGEALAFAKKVWEQENGLKFGFSGICSLSSSNTLDVSAMSLPSTCSYSLNSNVAYPHLVCPYNPAFYDTTHLDLVFSIPTISQDTINALMGSNAKPKFKVGDWVRDVTNGRIKKIISIATFDGKISYEVEPHSYIVEGISEKWIPKDGEYCAHTDEVGDALICIYKNKEREMLNYYVGCKTWISYRLDFNDWCIIEWMDRPATPEEIALLDSKLAEQGKRFDKGKLELVDIYKPNFAKGDIVRETLTGRIGVVDKPSLTETDSNRVYFTNEASSYWTDSCLKKIGNSL